MEPEAENRPPAPAPDPAWSALRWLMLLPVMGLALVGAGIVGALPCLFLNAHKALPLVGALCAAAWVLAAAWMAPRHQVRVAKGAFFAGALLAWPVARMADPPGWSPFAVWLLACGGGLAALWLALRIQPAELLRQALMLVHAVKTKGNLVMQTPPEIPRLPLPGRRARLLLLLLPLLWAGWMLARGIVDIIPQQNRGLHMRLGKYVATLEPGLHLKIPLVDQIIGVPVMERQGYIQHVDAMTQDNVIMKLSLQYTYEITDPRRYRLEVYDPDAIIREFVQGKLRDIVNTISMNDVMKKRQELGQHITADLAAKEHDFGVHFKLVQVQGAFPPQEVQEAIKQRMVSEQQSVAAKEQATQKQILADADFYEAGKRTEAMRYEIEETAKARKTSIGLLMEELARHEKLGIRYLDYLTAQELKSNSKWIISGDRAPQLHLDEASGAAIRSATPTS